MERIGLKTTLYSIQVGSGHSTYSSTSNKYIVKLQLFNIQIFSQWIYMELYCREVD